MEARHILVTPLAQSLTTFEISKLEAKACFEALAHLKKSYKHQGLILK